MEKEDNDVVVEENEKTGNNEKGEEVVVGEESLLERNEFRVERCNWIPFDDPDAPMEALAMIRYNHPGTPATIQPVANGQASVRLHEPQRAITPGQACVFYRDDLVLGGGWIMRDQ